MVSMIHHHDAIVRDAPKVPEFNEYPKCMAHPGFHPGDIGTEVRTPSGYSHYVGGTPARFAPVLVHSPDDEEYYAAKGYVSQGKSDPAAFARAAAAAAPAGASYVPVEYPKWAGGVLVNNADEEAEALAARREQLAIKEPEAASAPTQALIKYHDTTGMSDADMAQATSDAAPEVTLTGARLDAIEAQMADMRQMMAEMLRLQAAPLNAVKAQPTIETLEALLKADGPPVRIMPDGSVQTIEPAPAPEPVPEVPTMSRQMKAAITRRANRATKLTTVADAAD